MKKQLRQFQNEAYTKEIELQLKILIVNVVLNPFISIIHGISAKTVLHE
jgi:hypothetical protein